MKHYIKNMKRHVFQKLDNKTKISSYLQIKSEHSDFVKNLFHAAFVAAIDDSGSRCPCCNQTVKVYRRKLNANMCKFLVSLNIAVVRNETNGGDGFVHYSECSFDGRDYNQLSHWGLIEARQNDGTKKRCSGYWSITDMGEDFLKGKITVREYILCYNGKAKIDEDSDWVTFLSAYKNPFDYQELILGK